MAISVEPVTINHSIVISAAVAVAVFAVVDYVVDARKIYTGPVVEVVFEEAEVDEMAPKEKLELGIGV